MAYLGISPDARELLGSKQDTLVSGTNIKTLNGTSILGSGNVALAPSGLTLIATLTPTAAANVDALTVFSSDYDDYLILIDGVKPASSQDLTLRFAVSGVVDSSAVYGTDGGQVYYNAIYPPTDTSITCSPVGVLQSGVGFSGSVFVQNINSSSMKTVQVQGVWQ